VRIGLHLTSHQPPGGDPTGLVNDVLDQVSMAEELGFSHVFLGHHYLAPSTFLQPLSLAAYLAARTSSIRIGFGVLLMPLLPPVALAEELATLDVLSGGRVIVGLGAGYRPSEFAGLGVDIAERYPRLEQGVRVMRELWSGDTVDHTGLFGTLAGATQHLLPVQAGGPPIWIGARGARGLRRVAELDAVWLALVNFSDDVLQQHLLTLRAELVERGLSTVRDYPVISDAFVAATDTAALDLARQYARIPRDVAAQGGTQANTDDFLRISYLTGDPDSVLERMRGWSESLGITDVVLRLDWGAATNEERTSAIRMIGDEVVKEAASWSLTPSRDGVDGSISGATRPE
jgi:alkanesulfonate monooxygenase SsuD/methylene tetrahydromethanopterin reductase-like flavin-dependent oxidoreductase (luciferase family)